MHRLSVHLRTLLIDPLLNMRLRNKLFGVFMLVAVVPLLVVVLYSYNTIKGELLRQTYSNQMGTTEQIAANLSTKLETYSKVSSSLYLDPRLREFLSRDYTNNGSYVDAYEYINSTFNSILATNPEISSVTIYTTNPSLPIDNVYIRKADDAMKRNLWYEQVAHSYGSTTYTVMPPTSPPAEMVTKGLAYHNPARIVLARQLDHNSLNYPYGILTLEIPEADIYALMEKESKNKQLYIVSKDGTVISGKDKSLLNQSLKNLVKGDWSDDSSGSFIGNYKGNRVFLIYNSLPNGWRTVSIVSYKSLLKNMNTTFSRLFTLSLVAVVIAIMLIYTTARFFTKRIETLLQLTRRLEREDFNAPPIFMGHDEIGQLSFAMHKMTSRMRELINEVYKKEIAKKEAEMNMLQSQINPHFLYNSLASIASLAIRSADRRIPEMVSHLAKFYRISLNKGRSIINLNEELRLTRSYVAIQLLRFEGLVRVREDIDERVLLYPIVKLVLQPFIENAIHHAIWDDESPLNIMLRARIEDEAILLEVIDDGMGMRPETLAALGIRLARSTGSFSKEHANDDVTVKEGSVFREKYGFETEAHSIFDGNGSNTEFNTTAAAREDRTECIATIGVRGYGIRNVDQRIRMTFGDEYGVRIYSRLGIGTTVQIRFPINGPI